MAVQLIKKSDCILMPWKNGLGMTSQIDIFPAKAHFPDGFLWRLSSATVKTSSAFFVIQ